MIADYYRPKLNRDVVVYYDHTFTWESGSSTETYADIIERVFKENGYKVTMVYVGQAPKHEWKHLNIDLTLKGDPQFLWIQINGSVRKPCGYVMLIRASELSLRKIKKITIH